jgi:uncharacterized protein (DUF1778 family)
MTSLDTTKQERMHIRLDALTKQKLELAATYVHKSLSEFVLGQALNSADDVIREHETITLSHADCEAFLNALENPPKPNARLKKAFNEHKQKVKQ